MIRGAIISADGAYRMQLSRAISNAVGNTLRVCGWILNNPSTADAENDDNTVRKAWKYSTGWGYNGMVFLNTNPFRSTEPKLARTPPESILRVNDQWLVNGISACEILVCGWGDKANPVLAERVVRLLHPLGPLHCLRVTKQGNPQHPLYLPGDLVPKLWSPEKWLH